MTSLALLLAPMARQSSFGPSSWPFPWSWPWQVSVAAFLPWTCFVFFLISRINGWPGLARQFPGGSRPPADGTTYRFRSGRMPRGSFRNCLVVNISREGVYVVPIWVFRLFHPPLLLPWRIVRTVSMRQSFLGRALELDCGGVGWAMRIFLPASAAETVERQQAAARSGV